MDDLIGVHFCLLHLPFLLKSNEIWAVTDAMYASVERDSLLRLEYILGSVYIFPTIKICGYQYFYAYTPSKILIAIKLPAPARLP